MSVVTAGGPHALAARRGGVAAMGTRGRYRVSRFYGRNKFLCGERLMVGPDWKGTLVTAVCIIVPAVLYFTITYVRASCRGFFAVGWSRVRGLLFGSCSFFLFGRVCGGAEIGRRGRGAPCRVLVGFARGETPLRSAGAAFPYAPKGTRGVHQLATTRSGW